MNKNVQYFNELVNKFLLPKLKLNEIETEVFYSAVNIYRTDIRNMPRDDFMVEKTFQELYTWYMNRGYFKLGGEHND